MIVLAGWIAYMGFVQRLRTGGRQPESRQIRLRGSRVALAQALTFSQAARAPCSPFPSRLIVLIVFFFFFHLSGPVPPLYGGLAHLGLQKGSGRRRFGRRGEEEEGTGYGQKEKQRIFVEFLGKRAVDIGSLRLSGVQFRGPNRGSPPCFVPRASDRSFLGC